MFILLDTGPLGMLINPNPTSKTREIQLWMRSQLAKGIKMRVPEIADYEVRRNLILENLTDAISNLDALKTTIGYTPLNTDMMLMAANLWAAVRKFGLPTAPRERLDGDVILAAQARITSGGSEEVIIATENVGHLSRFDTATVKAKGWKDIT